MTLPPANYRALIVTGLLLLTGTAGAPALAADVEFKPTLSLSEEYNDNIFETASGKTTDLVTHVLPGATLNYRTPNLTWDSTYLMDYHYYARKSLASGADHTIGVKAGFSTADDFLKVDLSDTMSRISLNVARDTTQESISFAQTEQNSLLVSPYLAWRLGSLATLKTGVRYNDVRYFSANGIDQRQAGAFAQLGYDLTPKLSLTVEYNFGRTNTQILNYDNNDITGGFRFEYAANSFLYTHYGNSWQAFSNGARTTNPLWDAGISKDFEFAVASLGTQSSYTQDPLAVSTRQISYSAKLDKALERGNLSISVGYSEYLTALTSAASRRSVTVTASGSRQISASLSAAFYLEGDRLNRVTPLDYPYHFTGNGSLNWILAHEATLGLNYAYTTYRYGLSNASGAVVANRVSLQLSKAF